MSWSDSSRGGVLMASEDPRCNGGDSFVSAWVGILDVAFSWLTSLFVNTSVQC